MEYQIIIEDVKSQFEKGDKDWQKVFYLALKNLPLEIRYNSGFVVELIKLLRDIVEDEKKRFNCQDLFLYFPDVVLMERNVVLELSRSKSYRNYSWLPKELQEDEEIIRNLVVSDPSNFFSIPFEKKSLAINLLPKEKLNQINLYNIEEFDLEDLTLSAYILFFESNSKQTVIEFCQRIFSENIHEKSSYVYVRNFYCAHLSFILFKCYEFLKLKKESNFNLKNTIKFFKKDYSYALKFYKLHSKGSNWYENNLFMYLLEFSSIIELESNKKFSEEKILLNPAFIKNCKNLKLQEKLILTRVNESKEQLLKRIKAVSRLDWLVSSRDITQFPTNYANTQLLSDHDIMQELNKINVRQVNHFLHFNPKN